MKPLQASLSIKIQEYVSNQIPKQDIIQFDPSRNTQFNLPPTIQNSRSINSCASNKSMMIRLNHPHK